VTVDGVSARVDQIFSTTTRAQENADGSPATREPARFGFGAAGDYYRLLVRWDANTIEFFKGREVSREKLTAAIVLSSQPK
jgi:hypothetical protein